jgi:hypothetical protein
MTTSGVFEGGAAATWFGKAPTTIFAQLRFFAGSVATIMMVNKLCRGNVLGELQPGQEVYLPVARRRERPPPDTRGFVE